MSSNIIGKLLEAQIQTFVNDFSNNAQNVFFDESIGRLIHPGEFGMHRESCIRSFLNTFLPDIYGVSQGFVIGQDGSVSHQCDVIIYHAEFTPYFHTPEGQRFFPIESVIAVGEVKSKVDGSVLDDALEKLCNIKRMRDSITDASVATSRPSGQTNFDPQSNYRDQVVTFLLCEEVECMNSTLVGRILKEWNGSEARHRVNMVASIKSGTYLYKDSNSRPWMYPIEPDGSELSVRLMTPISANSHIALFIRYLILAIEDTKVLYPELTLHLNELLGCNVTDLASS